MKSEITVSTAITGDTVLEWWSSYASHARTIMWRSKVGNSRPNAQSEGERHITSNPTLRTRLSRRRSSLRELERIIASGLGGLCLPRLSGGRHRLLRPTAPILEMYQ